jgi:hypothetical protein
MRPNFMFSKCNCSFGASIVFQPNFPEFCQNFFEFVKNRRDSHGPNFLCPPNFQTLPPTLTTGGCMTRGSSWTSCPRRWSATCRSYDRPPVLPLELKWKFVFVFALVWPWIKMLVQNRSVFMKIDGDRFYRFTKNRLIKFDFFKNLK